MKLLVVTILSTIILAYALPELVMYTSYNLNKGYITEIFCINKEEPDLKCKGSCHLKKEVKKSIEESHQDKLPFMEDSQNNYYYPSFADLSNFLILAVSQSNDFYSTSNQFYHSFNGRLFRPPRLLSLYI